MSRDFGVTKPEYLEALREIREIKLPEDYWLKVFKSIADYEELLERERIARVYER